MIDSMNQPDSLTSKEQEFLKFVESSPLLQQALVRKLGLSVIGRKQPNTSYYNAACAGAIKVAVDDMIVSKADIEFPFEDYSKWSPETIRQKIHWGIQYLVEQMDEDGKYRNWRTNVEVSKGKESVIIRWIRANDVSILKHRRVGAEAGFDKRKCEDKGWKEPLLASIEKGENIMIGELSLNENDKEFVRSLFLDAQDFMVKVSTEKILIVKSEEAKEFPLNERIRIL